MTTTRRDCVAYVRTYIVHVLMPYSDVYMSLFYARYMSSRLFCGQTVHTQESANEKDVGSVKRIVFCTNLCFHFHSTPFKVTELLFDG